MQLQKAGNVKLWEWEEEKLMKLIEQAKQEQ